MTEIIEFLSTRWPQTPTEWALHIGAALVINFVVLSVMEHRIHKNLMHVQSMPRFVYGLIPFFATFQQRHHVLHHQTFYKQFDHEPDPEGRHENINIRFYQSVLMGIAVFPIWLAVFFVSPIVAIGFGLIGFAHNRLWGVVHTQMHMPAEDCWFKDSAVFRFLARHHFMHHQQMGKNYNVVFPFADWLFGTVATPGQSDVREMVRLGYVKARSSRGRRLAESLVPRTSAVAH